MASRNRRVLDALAEAARRLAVSAINACGVCVDARETVLREKGVGEEAILAAVRIASVIHALAAVIHAVTA